MDKFVSNMLIAYQERLNNREGCLCNVFCCNRTIQPKSLEKVVFESFCIVLHTSGLFGELHHSFIFCGSCTEICVELGMAAMLVSLLIYFW